MTTNETLGRLLAACLIEGKDTIESAALFAARLGLPEMREALKEAKKLFELGITHANGGGRPDGMSPFLQAENIHALIEAALKKSEVTG